MRSAAAANHVSCGSPTRVPLPAPTLCFPRFPCVEAPRAEAIAHRAHQAGTRQRTRPYYQPPDDQCCDDCTPKSTTPASPPQPSNPWSRHSLDTTLRVTWTSARQWGSGGPLYGSRYRGVITLTVDVAGRTPEAPWLRAARMSRLSWVLGE